MLDFVQHEHFSPFIDEIPLSRLHRFFIQLTGQWPKRSVGLTIMFDLENELVENFSL